MFDYTFQWRPAFEALPQMIDGTIVTLKVAVISMVIGTAIGIVLALGRESHNRIARSFCTAWVEVARNTPALLQIYLIYFGLGSIGLQLDSLPSLMIGIAFNNAGYLAEIFRGGLRAVPATQMRAGRSLGMGWFKTFWLIVLPQLLRVTFYPACNQMVWAILNTSLGVIVGLDNDLTGVTQGLNVLTFRTFEFFSLAACLYYLLVKVVLFSARVLGWRLFRY
ncbi:amino acid ABC transporter permease [Ralstonia syzygii]|uniref:Putative amino acid ABC transporter permease protein n=1 Tax=Ralstonia syzygii R24 TaxID=907261 RepID=G2ZZC6_9RALS|nr:amino acid ABC transporter permease [Ralstonia syzygii]CCA84228.1 putative amino acid ABC transporter permease protein [Ralstonia syzygii R24]